MEARIARLESDVAHLRTDVADIKVDVRSLRDKMDGMGERFDGNIRKDDLNEFTPYNTYRIDGLPPTPIANPGKAAIDAALHPAPTDALYFVAKGDGSHQFSVTLEDHEAAVRQYQHKRRADYRSSRP